MQHEDQRCRVRETKELVYLIPQNWYGCTQMPDFEPAEPPSYDADSSFRRARPVKAASFMAELGGESVEIYGEA